MTTERAPPVLFGLHVSSDARISMLYTGPELAALFDDPPALRAHAEDAQPLLESIRASARSGSPWHFTWRTHHGRRVESVAVCLQSEGGATLHGWVREVLDENLRDGAARFENIVEASPVPYAINDEQQNITYVNPAFVATFGYAREDIPTLADWWPRAYPDIEYRTWVSSEWQARLERARRDNSPFEPFEVRIQAKDGSRRFAIAGALSLNSAFRGIHVVVLLDVTERKRAEDARLSLERQVQHAQKLESLGVLAGGIAHDFNNLLMTIVGNVDVALAQLHPTSPARASMDAVQAAARRASEVADQMLAYAGKGKFVVTELVINDLVAEMSQLLEIAISKKAALRCHFEPSLPRFDGDATQVRQVVMNLITNASEAIGDQPGVVTLRTGVMTCDRAYLDGNTIVHDRLHRDATREGKYVFLEVTDTGCGMTPETIARIFEPFFTTKFTGRGLGLSALLGIVHGHAGAIEIRSEVGKGTAVRVLFPATVDDSPAIAVRSAPSELVGNGIILLVDDEDAIRRVVRQMLEQLGYTVVLAANGRDAIDMFRERQRDIAAVILDLTMPVLDGEQTFRELRAVHPSVKVILSSGYSDVEVSRRFASGDLAGFLKKPFDMDALGHVLAATVVSRKAPVTSGS